MGNDVFFFAARGDCVVSVPKIWQEISVKRQPFFLLADFNFESILDAP